MYLFFPGFISLINVRDAFVDTLYALSMAKGQKGHPVAYERMVKFKNFWARQTEI